jgi:hypothetical protein
MAPVEMMKVKSRKHQVLDTFGSDFRPIHIVQAKFNARPERDEALCALLWEYQRTERLYSHGKVL